MLKLYPFQEQTVDFIHANKGRCLLALDQGLGKTAISVNYINRTQSYPAVIVCTVSTKGSWEKEFKDWAGVTCHQVEGEEPYLSESTAFQDNKVIIINYDILAHHLPCLVSAQFRQCVFDECHYLGNNATKRTQAAIKLARSIPRVIGASGTPISNKPKNFFPILHIIRPNEFPSFDAYAWRYCDPTFYRGQYHYNGCTNAEELHERIKPFTIRLMKKDVLQLKDQRKHVIPLEIPNSDEYQKASDNFSDWLARSGIYSEKARKAEAVMKTTYLLNLIARLKAKTQVEYIQKFMREHPEKKVIVFAKHQAVVDVMHRRIAPGQSVFINGTVPAKKRTAIIKQFQEDPNIRVIVCNITAAGAGVTLTAATAMFFVELPWNASDLVQASDRNYRIGQDEDVDIYFLVAKNTIDERICRLIQEKQDATDMIISGEKSKSAALLEMLKEAACQPNRKTRK